MHDSKWMPGGDKPGDSDMENVYVRIPTLSWTFTIRMPSQKIYISTICNVKMMLEWLAGQNPRYGQTDPCQNPEGDWRFPQDSI